MLKKNKPTLSKAGMTIKRDRPTMRQAEPPPSSEPSEPFAEGEPTRAEQSVKEELDELQAGFRARSRAESQRFVQATDSEYWVALCFQTREQKEEFLQKLGLLELGDKYLDGLEVAAKLGVEVESPTPKMPKLHIDRTLKKLARSL